MTKGPKSSYLEPGKFTHDETITELFTGIGLGVFFRPGIRADTLLHEYQTVGMNQRAPVRDVPHNSRKLSIS